MKSGQSHEELRKQIERERERERANNKEKERELTVLGENLVRFSSCPK